MKILFSLLNALVRLFLVSLASPALRYVNVLASSWGMSWPLIGQCRQSGLLIGRKLHPRFISNSRQVQQEKGENDFQHAVKTIFVLCFCVNHHAKIGPKPGGSIIKLACRPLSFSDLFSKSCIDTRYPHSLDIGSLVCGVFGPGSYLPRKFLSWPQTNFTHLTFTTELKNYLFILSLQK